jgi:PTS system cellobiose-specific IIC component
MCGIHGANIVYGVAAPMLYTLMDQNLQAFKAGQEIPNIVSQNMFDIFVSIGGSGGTLGLVILMMLKARSAHLKELGKLSFGPALFNINEPIIFGTPIVMNPLMLIPFLVSPVVAVTLAYFGMKTGLVAKLPGIAAPWTSPAFFGAFIASVTATTGLTKNGININGFITIGVPNIIGSLILNNAGPNDNFPSSFKCALLAFNIINITRPSVPPDPPILTNISNIFCETMLGIS